MSAGRAHLVLKWNNKTPGIPDISVVKERKLIFQNRNMKRRVSVKSSFKPGVVLVAREGTRKTAHLFELLLQGSITYFMGKLIVLFSGKVQKGLQTARSMDPLQFEH
jgi:hypothetical protein